MIRIGLLTLLTTMMLVGLTITGISDARYPQDLDHDKTIVYFKNPRITFPVKRDATFHVDIAVMNMNYANRIEGFHIDFRFPDRNLDIVEVEPIDRGYRIIDLGLGMTRDSRDFYRTQVHGNWHQYRRHPEDGMDSIHGSLNTKRSSGNLVRLIFRVRSLVLPHHDMSDDYYKIEFVRVLFSYKDGVTSRYGEPYVYGNSTNNVMVFNTRLSRGSSNDITLDGRVDNDDLHRVILNYGNYLEDSFFLSNNLRWDNNHIHEDVWWLQNTVNHIDSLRLCDVDTGLRRRWIIDGDDLRKMSCVIDKRKNRQVCELLFGRLKAVKK